MNEAATLLDRVKGWLHGTTDDERLAEIDGEIKTREKALAELAAPRKVAVLEKMIGQAGTADRVTALDAADLEHRARLVDLRDAKAELERRRRESAVDQLRREAAERPRQAAELVRQRRRLAEEATTAAQDCADAIMALKVNGDALAALVDDTAARRFLSFDATRHRVQSALARAFQIDLAAPLTLENSLIGVASHEIGPRSWWSISDHEQNGLDDLCPYFDDHAAAAVQRLAERDSNVVVALPDECLVLVPHDWLFATREDAVAAIAGRLAQHEERTALVPFAGGYALVKRRFAGVAD